MVQIRAYVRRNGDCREMMEFYRACLGGTLELSTIQETPVAGDFPEAMQHRVMHATLTSGAVTLLGSDLPDPSGHQPGNDWALELDCASAPELHRLFESLSQRGTVHMAPGPAFWGGLFAQLTDQFDVDWMLTCPTPDPRPEGGAPA